MNRLQCVAAVAGLVCAGSAASQNLAVSFQPTGEPDTYDMVAELFGPLAPPITDEPVDTMLAIWSDTTVRFTGDGPITILSWNPAYDTLLASPEVTGDGTNDVEFFGAQNLVFGTPDSSNPFVSLRFRYEGSPEAFSAEMSGQNLLLGPAVSQCSRGCLLLYMSIVGDLGPLTHSFGPLPGVECTPDVNGDGFLSPADFNGWIIAFNSGAPECDQNGDGACTPADFNGWILNYNAGC